MIQPEDISDEQMRMLFVIYNSLFGLNTNGDIHIYEVWFSKPENRWTIVSSYWPDKWKDKIVDNGLATNPEAARAVLDVLNNKDTLDD